MESTISGVIASMKSLVNLAFTMFLTMFISFTSHAETMPPDVQTLPPEVVEAKPKMYEILGTAKVGSKFRHVEASFPVPFDRTYSALDEEQRGIYRKIYTWLTEKELAVDQTPPYPVKGLRSLYEPIIKKNKLVAINKTVFFIVDIKETGEVDQVKVYSSPNKEFTEFINILAFTTKFEPGTCAGEPCAMEFPFELDLRYVHRNTNITGNIGDSSWKVTQPR